MGRKIPGRKHRGVRDPNKQRAARLESLKDKINAPPTNPEEQYIPKSLSRVIDLKDKVKNGAFTKKKKKSLKQNDVRNSKRAKSELIQRQGESDKSFLRRATVACETAIQEAAFEKKYNVEIKKNPETGQVEKVIKKKRDEIDELMQKARKAKDKKVKKPKKKIAIEPRLTKTEKRKLKLKEKKEKKLKGKANDFDSYKDSVKFGEIVHEPPNLVLPKKADTKLVPRPGGRDLHLKSLFNAKRTSDVSVSSMAIVPRKTSNKVINKKGKRKDLPIGVRRQLDKQQKEIIEAYKQLKERKPTS